MSELILRDATVTDLPVILSMLAEDTIPANREADPSDWPPDERVLDAFARLIGRTLRAGDLALKTTRAAARPAPRED